MEKGCKISRYLLIPFFALSLTLAGCSGDDGDDGRPGATGAKGEDSTNIIPGSGSAASFAVPQHADTNQSKIIKSTIEKVTVGEADGTITVDFTVDGNPDSVKGEFTIAKWLPGENSWISMLQRSRPSKSGDVTVIRGDNRRPEAPVTAAGGMFSYTFADSNTSVAPIDFRNGAYWLKNEWPTGAGDYGAYVAAIVDEINTLAVWDANAVYRIGVSRFNEQGEYFFTAVTYVDGTGQVVANPTAEDSALASCIGCHGDRGNGQTWFKAHGSFRHDPQLCTTCHNDFTFDRANSKAEVGGWTPLDMMTIIHKLHAKIEGYTIDGYKFDLSFPDWLFGRSTNHGEPWANDGVRNCTACHGTEIPAAKTSWNTVSLNACASCHTDKAFHFAANDCSGCHDGSSVRSAEQFHGIADALAQLTSTRDYVMEVVAVENAVAGQPAKVTWRVKKGDVYQDLFAGADTYLDNVRLSIGWGYGDDFTNDGSGNSTAGDAGRPFQVVTSADNTVAGSDATYAVTTFGALPAAATEGRFGFVALELGPAGIDANSTVKTFALGEGVVNATELGERRQVVSAENCRKCHTAVTRHGVRADTDVVACITCHNAGSLSRDASVVQGTVDFMYLMHGIHGIGEKRDRLDRRRDHGYTYITYPNTVLDCNACHVNGSQNVVDAGKRLGVIADGGKQLYVEGAGVNSPFASVCYSCHQDGAESVRAHILSQGGNMLGNATHTDYVDGNRGESCLVCH